MQITINPSQQGDITLEIKPAGITIPTSENIHGMKQFLPGEAIFDGGSASGLPETGSTSGQSLPDEMVGMDGGAASAMIPPPEVTGEVSKAAPTPMSGESQDGGTAPTRVESAVQASLKPTEGQWRGLDARHAPS